MVRASGRAVLVALCLVGGAAACGSGFIDRLFEGPYPDDAGQDASAPDTGTAVHPSCGKHPPDKPAIADDPGGDTFVLALRTIAFEGNDSDGLDLDNVCTCKEDDAGSCVAVGDQLNCDGPEGRDNSLGKRLGLFFSQVATPDFATDDIAGGRYTMMIGVSGWNGKPDDQSVAVGLFTSRAFESEDGGDGGKPKFDGTDRWSVDPASLAGDSVDAAVAQKLDCSAVAAGCLPRFFTQDAYVVNNELVVHLAEGALTLSTTVGTLSLALTDGIITGMLAQDGGIKTLSDGQFVGRFKGDDIITGLGRLDAPNAAGVGLCNNSAYPELKSALCPYVDVTSDPSKDNTNQPCDALSGGFSFTAVQARAGHVRAVPLVANDCKDFTDTCKKD